MNAVTGKLKSKSGISLAIALVFFLLCAMVGTAVLSSATVSAGNTAREHQLYRETLALTSAVDLLRQDLRDTTYTGAYIRKETVITSVDPNGILSTKVETSETYEPGVPKLEHSRLFRVKQNADGTYSDNLNLTKCYLWNQGKPSLNGGATEEPAAQTITFSAVEAQNVPEVTGSLTVEKDYTLTVVLHCGDNTLTVTFPPHAVSRTEVAAPVTTPLTNTVTQKVTATTYAIDLSWGQPSVKEGGASHG